ncbi:hypothetical protein GN956_G21523 [Arapaima gigas]
MKCVCSQEWFCVAPATRAPPKRPCESTEKVAALYRERAKREGSVTRGTVIPSENRPPARQTWSNKYLGAKFQVKCLESSPQNHMGHGLCQLVCQNKLDYSLTALGLVTTAGH